MTKVIWDNGLSLQMLQGIICICHPAISNQVSMARRRNSIDQFFSQVDMWHLIIVHQWSWVLSGLRALISLY
jgi:hypothetical protein